MAAESQPGTFVFLDIDGVLHSLYGQDMFRESCSRVLEKIVNTSGAAIVLSSTWRLQQRSTDQVNLFLKRRGLPTIYDKTPDLTTISGRQTRREVEICHWLDRHPEVLSWIAIDDMDLQADQSPFAARMRGHFVKTDSSNGLTPHHGELALKLLNRQLAALAGPLSPLKSLLSDRSPQSRPIQWRAEQSQPEAGPVVGKANPPGGGQSKPNRRHSQQKHPVAGRANPPGGRQSIR